MYRLEESVNEKLRRNQMRNCLEKLVRELHRYLLDIECTVSKRECKIIVLQRPSVNIIALPVFYSVPPASAVIRTP